MIIPIRLYGDQCLKDEAYDVELEEGDNVVDLVNDLFETLYASGTGVGLAATQIGVPLRVFVAKHEEFESEFINPELIFQSKEMEFVEEGCLSIPTVGINVNRSKNIKLKYFVLDGDGKLVEKIEEFEGYVARIIQHEIDHLDGICITDKVKGLARTILQPKLRKITQGRTQYRYPTLHKSHPEYKKVIEEVISKYIKE